jgi:hypothetical protein
MDGGYSFAFTPTADKLVCFGWGKAKYFTIPSGKDWEPAVAHLFPSDNADQCSSRLVSGQTGDLFVLIHDYKKKTIAIRDLETGREVSSWESQFVPEICTGGIVEWSGVHQRLREIPSGKQRQSLQSKVHLAGSLLMEYHVCTPDCRTLLVVDGAIRKCTDGIETKLDLPAHQFPAISPDGRLLAVLVHQAQSYDGMSRWLSKLGLMHRDAVFVIYDLTTATEIARVPNVTYAHFAQDGQTLALFKDDAVELYDLPLNSPWDWIATAAMVAAGFVFLVGQWMRCRRKSKPNRPMKHGPDETKCG